MPNKPRIAIIGAGPIGLEAALYARLKSYDVTVYERGSIAENIRQWGHVRMFSPFGINSSEWGREALAVSGHRTPGAEILLTGHEFTEQYLKPISRLPILSGVIKTPARVDAIGRGRSLKAERLGDPQRADEPFELHGVCKGAEMYEGHADDIMRPPQADVVLDCSGTFGSANWIGAGGKPCLFETATRRGVQFGLPDMFGNDRVQFAGRITAVIGSGYSAATNVIALARLAKEEPCTVVLWITRKLRDQPIEQIVDDRLSERSQIAQQANSLALQNPLADEAPMTAGYEAQAGKRAAVIWARGGHVRFLSRLINKMTSPPTDRCRLMVERPAVPDWHVLSVDNVIANVGYRPDRSLYEELQVHECYATQGPMKLAAKLLGETSADCLDQVSHGPEVLRNPEPNFYILGMKSYGRKSNFLIQIGLQQIVDVFSLIERDWGLA